MGQRVRWLINFCVFQVGWFACVLGGAHQLPILGSGMAMLGVALHVAMAARPRPELLLALAAALLGGAWDSLLVGLGLMSYTSGQLAPGLTAHWIIALWALFATTLNSSMGWIHTHTLLPWLVGGVGGPLSYLAGFELGAVAMPDVTLALGAQAVGWCLLLPLVSTMAARLSSAQARATTSQNSV